MAKNVLNKKVLKKIRIVVETVYEVDLDSLPDVLDIIERDRELGAPEIKDFSLIEYTE